MTNAEAKEWIVKLISTMKEETSGMWADPQYKDEVYEALGMAIEALSVEPQEWISVKDRLPTENDEYYVSIRYECDDGTAFDDVTTCYFWAKEGVWNGSERMIGKILAWQPITEPSPYKGGNNR